jgi:2-desacetyl-2-hydroxyethyl bacteriochlorophyllide A dehydrogenase
MGATYLCYRLRIIGVEEPGGMRDYHAVPTDRLLRVPLALTDEVAALIEPLAVAVHDVTRAAVESGEAALVLGGGPIGALIALVCRHRGARVAVSEVNPFRVDLLRGLGLEVLGPGTDVAAFVEAWTEGAGADVVFEVTGQPAAVRLMTDVVRVWGRVSVVAIHAEPMPVALYPVFARELSLHGSRLYTRAAWHEAIGLAASGTLPLAPLVTHVVPLGDLMDGLQAALRGGPVMKVLVDATR